jgi:hypothetical protein
MEKTIQELPVLVVIATITVMDTELEQESRSVVITLRGRPCKQMLHIAVKWDGPHAIV